MIGIARRMLLTLAAALAMVAAGAQAQSESAASGATPAETPAVQVPFADGVVEAEPTPAPSPASARKANPARAPVAQKPAPPAGIGIDISLPGGDSKTPDTALAVRVVLGLTLLAILPALLVCMTSFLRIIIVLSMLRHAIGMPETPPNTVLIGLALFLSLFTMSPVLQSLNQDALQPFMQGKLTNEAAYEKASAPLRDFMVRQTREQDLALMIDLSKGSRPQTMDEVSNVQLIPAFMLSELRAAFQIGFVVFLPFLLIDLIVSSILMALGMMMMPPMTVALPLKVLMFILVDGWGLLLKALIGSFH